MIQIYFDGGATPNPGAQECAIVFGDKSLYLHKPLGNGTNNEAEWIGFVEAIKLASHLAESEVEILGDSKLVIMQAMGEWKIKAPNLRKYYDEFQLLKPKFQNLKLTHVKRHLNMAGKYLEELQKK